MNESTDADDPFGDPGEEPRIVVIEIDASTARPKPRTTPGRILGWMKARMMVGWPPLPEGYVPPPGVDVDALLKQLPPPRRRPEGG